MDEKFHGGNLSEGIEPTDQVLRIDTLMHSAHAAHGDFRLHYSDTVLCAINGRIWADWAVTGIRPDTLVALPYIGWFSPQHRLALKFGWWELAVRVGDSSPSPYRVKTWYEASAIPVSEFYGSDWRARSWCAVPPGETRLVHHLRLTPPAAPNRWPTVTLALRGATTLGEEAGSPFDPVNATVGDCAPLPSKLTTEVRDDGLLITNAPADLSGRLTCSQPVHCEITPGEATISSYERHMRKEQVRFELRCPLAVPPEGDVIVSFELVIEGESSHGKVRAAAPSVEDAREAWQAPWSCLESLRTPDPLLTATLKRAAVYAAAMLPTIDGTDEAAGFSDHVEWPVDCARDSFHIASALLLLKPELARRHLAFYFLNAIPRAGAGKSYVPTGESRGHRAARLLDLAAYPLLELWRYWCATGDSGFVEQKRVRQTVGEVVEQVATWQDPRTGMFTSTERSSDERCVFPLFVPGNALLVGTLERLIDLAREPWRDERLARRLRELAARARQGIPQHAVVEDPEFGPMFAFEVGQPGEYLLYDHADMPNLLSLPRFGFCRPDDPIYRNTVRFAYSRRNQGFRGTADGKYRQLCDGSKTMPSSPWPLGALGQLMSGAATPSEAARSLDWLRDAITPALQLPEISDKYTARPIQRYWFAWPTAMLLMAYIEVVCGVKVGREIRVEPLVPEGWSDFSSPTFTLRGQEVRVEVHQGQPHVTVNGQDAGTGFLLKIGN